MRGRLVLLLLCGTIFVALVQSTSAGTKKPTQPPQLPKPKPPPKPQPKPQAVKPPTLPKLKPIPQPTPKPMPKPVKAVKPAQPPKLPQPKPHPKPKPKPQPQPVRIIQASQVQGVSPTPGCKPGRCFVLCSGPKDCKWVPWYPLQVSSRWDCSKLPCKLRVDRRLPPGRSMASARVKVVNEADVVMYPTIFSSQAMVPRYQFTRKHFLQEQAEQILESGATVFKFHLNPIKANHKPDQSYLGKGWLPLVQSPQFPYLQIMDMPFKVFQVRAGEIPGPGRPWNGADIYGVDVYKEMYKLAVFLLKRYRNTGKVFMIGHWEGDWAIRDDFELTSTPNPRKVVAMMNLLSVKQKAINDAKAHNPKIKGVHLWHYAEANLVELSRLKGPKFTSMINTIIPKVRPPIDYVSVSAGGASFRRDPDPTPDLHANLDYAAFKLPSKAGVPGPRAFIGEYRFMLWSRTDVESGDTPQDQKEKGLWAAASAVAWGTPYMLWWAVYETETTRSGGYRGFWLVDNKGRETPLYVSMQQYWKDSQAMIRSVLAAKGRPPTNYEFRSWAAKRLVELSGTPYKVVPPVKKWA